MDAVIENYAGMYPRQQRVVLEKAVLDLKITDLAAFVGTPVYLSLPSDEQSRLTSQLAVMKMYTEILGERIAAF